MLKKYLTYLFKGIKILGLLCLVICLIQLIVAEVEGRENIRNAKRVEKGMAIYNATYIMGNQNNFNVDVDISTTESTYYLTYPGSITDSDEIYIEFDPQIEEVTKIYRR